MLFNHKNYFFSIFFAICSFEIKAEENPYIYIDKNAQLMVETLKNNKQLFADDRDLFEDKIKEISEYANRKEEISVDLNDEKIIYGNNEVQFKIDSFKKKCLLEGLDDG